MSHFAVGMGIRFRGAALLALSVCSCDTAITADRRIRILCRSCRTRCVTTGSRSIAAVRRRSASGVCGNALVVGVLTALGDAYPHTSGYRIPNGRNFRPPGACGLMSLRRSRATPSHGASSGSGCRTACPPTFCPTKRAKKNRRLAPAAFRVRLARRFSAPDSASGSCDGSRLCTAGSGSGQGHPNSMPAGRTRAAT